MSVASQEILTASTGAHTHTCYHCGTECEEEPILFDDKPFCCEGCRMVYDILNTNGMCKYYDLDANAGISLKSKRRNEYAYLDDPEIAAQLVQFTDGKQTNITFYVPAMHCNSCIWLLENLYRLSEGILTSTVNFPKKEVFIRFENAGTSLRKIVELLASIGYEPTINYGDLSKDKNPIVNRTFYYQLGVAGFAFGNIMLMSFPEYLGLQIQHEGFYARLFGYLNILLSIPVLVYSGRDYPISAWQGLRNRQLTMDVPIALGIITLFIRSVYEILAHTGAGYLDSLAGLVFFLLIGKWFQQRTYYHISFERDYRSYFPIAATIKVEEETSAIALDKLKPGDVIIVKREEIIPADAMLVRGEARIDYSFVSGESEPVALTIGEKVFAGGRQMGGPIELLVNKKVSQSYLTQLWNNEVFHKPQHLVASELANQVGKYFTITILLIGILSLLYWLPKNTHIAINAFTSVLIIACPCAVALAIPFIFGNILRILGRHEFYLRNTAVIEALKKVNAVVLDKTGTLTSREQQQYTFEGKLTADQVRRLLAITRASNHPVSEGIHQSLRKTYPQLVKSLPAVAQWEEFTGKGIQAIVEGHELRLGSADFIDAEGQGVLFEENGQVLGHFQAQLSLRKGLSTVVQYLKNLWSITLLSGDSTREKTVFENLMPENAQLHFQQSPFDKLHYIEKLQKEGQRVLMIGDGLNDAGALKQSNVGIVVTEENNNFTPACDAILRADAFEKLPQLLQLARRSVYLVFGAYALAFAYNVVGLSYAVQGVFTPIVAAILMPVSSITIVIYGLISSNLLAKKWGL